MFFYLYGNLYSHFNFLLVLDDIRNSLFDLFHLVFCNHVRYFYLYFLNCLLNFITDYSFLYYLFNLNNFLNFQFNYFLNLSILNIPNNSINWDFLHDFFTLISGHYFLSDDWHLHRSLADPINDDVSVHADLHSLLGCYLHGH